MIRLMLLSLYDALGVIKWHDNLAGGPFIFGVTLSLMMLPGALINAGLCYFVGSKLQRN